MVEHNDGKEDEECREAGLSEEQEALLLEYLATMQSLVYSEQCARVLQQVEGQDVVIFLGNTRAGKSTVVNYTIGNHLRAVKIKKNHFKILVEEDSSGPCIGTEAVSETTIPTAWNSSKVDGLVVDAPGFDDNRGEAQDVANAFYIKELIANTNSIKFVLISDINDIIHDNIAQFINFIDKIHTMLPKCEKLHESTIVVFNKDREETTKKEICDYLYNKIIKHDKIKTKNRKLLKFLICNPQQIVICQMPFEEGPIQETDVFCGLVKSIKTTPKLPRSTLAGLSPGISDRSRCFLLEAHTYLTEMRELNEALKSAEDSFMETVGQYTTADISTTNDMIEVKGKIMIMEEKIKCLMSTPLDLKETLSRLGEIVPDLQVLHKDSKLYIKIKFISFVDQILGIEESTIINVKINTALSAMKDALIGCRIQLQEKMLEISSEEAARRFKALEQSRANEEKEFKMKLEQLEEQHKRFLDKQRQEQRKGPCNIL